MNRKKYNKVYKYKSQAEKPEIPEGKKLEYKTKVKKTYQGEPSQQVNKWNNRKRR